MLGSYVRSSSRSDKSVTAVLSVTTRGSGSDPTLPFLFWILRRPLRKFEPDQPLNNLSARECHCCVVGNNTAVTVSCWKILVRIRFLRTDIEIVVSAKEQKFFTRNVVEEQDTSKDSHIFYHLAWTWVELFVRACLRRALLDKQGRSRTRVWV